MIDKNEMRIGNYFYCGDKILWLSEIMHLKEVKEWVYEGWHEETKQRYSINFFDAEPIVITTEILKQWCGFDKNILQEGKLSKGIYHVVFEESETGNSFFIYGDLIRMDLKYLHQIQNLYFAITGEELQVNIGNEVNTN